MLLIIKYLSLIKPYVNFVLHWQALGSWSYRRILDFLCSVPSSDLADIPRAADLVWNPTLFLFHRWVFVFCSFSEPRGLEYPVLFLNLQLQRFVFFAPIRFVHEKEIVAFVGAACRDT
jgi:hypothetical protein